MLAKFQKSAYRLLMKISAGWGCGNSVVLDISTDWVVEILLLWIFLPTGYGNSVALVISASWGCGNSVALDISADWVVEILLFWIFLPTGLWKFCCL